MLKLFKGGIEVLKNYLQVKKIIALLLTVVFCYLAITGRITSEQYINIFSIVIAFYFGQSTARQAAEESKQGRIG